MNTKLLDNLTQVIYAGNFASELSALKMRAATDEGVRGIRIFVADIYVASKNSGL